MTEAQTDAKVSYPYMTSGQWFGVRAKLRQSLPGTVDVDWVMAALGTSEKGAKNVIPQLRAVGLIGSDGKPTDLAHDVRDDADYPKACRKILETMYPPALLSAYDDPTADAADVARWFMRNAGTGELTARNQAKLYLVLLKGELPPPEEAAKKASVKKSSAPAKKAPSAPAKTTTTTQPSADATEVDHPSVQSSKQNGVGPALHIDLQIHIAADASDTQIDTIFKSMAKHLYGRE